MSLSFSYLPYTVTHSFSPLVKDYLSQHPHLKPFFKYNIDREGLSNAILDRKNNHVDREVLVSVLRQQYERVEQHQKVADNIELLLNENTFTVCTAHQPNLLTGYLYFIYKIVHAVRLAEELRSLFPHNNFVPVYYMGSEDNDLVELGAFRFNGEKYTWDAAGQTGAVGRMNTESLKPLLEELFKKLGPPGENCEALTGLLQNAYAVHNTIAAATQYLVNELFGRFGLLVLDPDNRLLKRQFIEVMKDDLLHHTAYKITTEQISSLAENYKVQAHPRQINLFYLHENIRERIEKTGDKWQVLNTSIAWTEDELIGELNSYPERFSPNVILRGLFQETILPDVAFIGGGAELAYWLQLNSLFEHYNVFYPSVHLRQSVLWAGTRERKLREALGLSVAEVFMPETKLVHQFVRHNGSNDWETEQEATLIENALETLKGKATALDPTLKAAAEAVLAKIRYQVQVLEKKMLRAEKRRMHTDLQRIQKLKALLFPNSALQERVENFMTYYLSYGADYLDILKDKFEPLRHEFLVIEEE